MAAGGSAIGSLRPNARGRDEGAPGSLLFSAPRLGRRRFIGLSAAAVCVGCSDADADGVDGAAADGERDASPSDTGRATFVPDAATSLPLGAIHVGRLSDFADVSAPPTYVPEARAFVVALDRDAAEAIAREADERLRPGLAHGLLALDQKCPHLGCRVPFCESSGWFECMCHGTMFARNGEHRDGPGPRGLDAFVIVVAGDDVAIDRGVLVAGALTGTVVVDRPPAGPHCVNVSTG